MHCKGGRPVWDLPELDPLNCPTKLAPPKMECPLGPTTLLLWGPLMSMLNYNAMHWGPHTTVKMGPPRRQHIVYQTAIYVATGHYWGPYAYWYVGFP